jgi:hypothetical protein
MYSEEVVRVLSMINQTLLELGEEVRSPRYAVETIARNSGV